MSLLSLSSSGVSPTRAEAAILRVRSFSGMRSMSANASSTRPSATSNSPSAPIASSLAGSICNAIRRLPSSPPAINSLIACSCSDGASESIKAWTSCSGCAPMNPLTTAPSCNAYTAGIDCTLNA